MRSLPTGRSFAAEPIKAWLDIPQQRGQRRHVVRLLIDDFPLRRGQRQITAACAEGDLRRLLRLYGRAVAATWPKGPYKDGVSYGTDVVFILTSLEQANPNVRTCADQNP